MLHVEVRGSSVRVSVHVQPRATRSEIVGLHGEALKVRLQAPPVDGAANEALVTLLAERLGVARRSVRVVAGALVSREDSGSGRHNGRRGARARRPAMNDTEGVS